MITFKIDLQEMSPPPHNSPPDHWRFIAQKWSTWQFPPCVRSPPEPWEVTDPGFSVWVKAKRLPWRLGPNQKAQRSWGEGLAFSYELLTCSASLVYLRPRDSTVLPPAALCWFTKRCKAHVFTIGAWLHSPAAAWVWRLNPGLWVQWLRQHKPLPACGPGCLAHSVLAN